jgi:hypothetical protein
MSLCVQMEVELLANWSFSEMQRKPVEAKLVPLVSVAV